MLFSKDKSQHTSLDIVLATDPVILRGTGADVEPGLLSGNVVLFLTEATSIKQITLQFRGKARLPQSLLEPHVLSGSHNVYVACQHDWSFLEGAKKQSHTLKPGRHFFPFQLTLGGSLPSSITTRANSGASMSYKLRATAVRSGITATNLTATCPVKILRTIAPAALEYQQTLEIENTWPEKLMYSIVLPHKAWAAGDDLTALMKFVPLAKGVRVLHVTTSINETTKTFARGARVEHTGTKYRAYHEIINGEAVPCDFLRIHQLQERHHHSTPSSTAPSPGASTSFLSHFQRQPRPDSVPSSSEPDTAGPSSARPSESNDTHPAFSSDEASASASSSQSVQPSEINDEDTCGEISTKIVIPLPATLTPSHPLDPILVSHRIRWSILIGNFDGHTSELRCSLPLHILDESLMDEARRSTAVTRRLLFGGPELREEEEEIELPSYPSHVRDRVASVFLPESAAIRVTNPWVQQHADPLFGSAIVAPPLGARTPASGLSTPSTQPSPLPDLSGSVPSLEWVNSELLLSQSDTIPTHTPPLSRVSTPPDSESASASGSSSRWQSQRVSRVNSRSGSPDHEMHVHAPNPTRPQQHELYTINMKPLTTLPHPFSHGYLPHSQSHPPARPHPPSRTHSVTGAVTNSGGNGGDSPRAISVAMLVTADPANGAELLHRAFTEVPTYDVASRGFLGGGPPPLDSMRGLPSYDEARESSLQQ
ncbi:hypothetical protein BD410DRAFT_732926 [Rickenella mellea]|uniref:Arrestin C-terminal-like domain-containing protein n=1 Tax=Rickenella mellea TaxID=50990 RepID=A0A4Y7PJA9_9AGAM|nr:hypothetical protein BD410DRAFT_732926 [Rickenella mellea]